MIVINPIQLPAKKESPRNVPRVAVVTVHTHDEEEIEHDHPNYCLVCGRIHVDMCQHTHSSLDLKDHHSLESIRVRNSIERYNEKHEYQERKSHVVQSSSRITGNHKLHLETQIDRHLREEHS